MGTLITVDARLTREIEGRVVTSQTVINRKLILFTNKLDIDF
jgi:hypothetical protein